MIDVADLKRAADDVGTRDLTEVCEELDVDETSAKATILGLLRHYSPEVQGVGAIVLLIGIKAGLEARDP